MNTAVLQIDAGIAKDISPPVTPNEQRAGGPGDGTLLARFFEIVNETQKYT